ncbi:chemotaxis protein CheW [Candidatus Poribacteria bacterium]|jgi:purine-binding chemotaxis protein CheW|nr:chemotaxis protein CheW [Candidatus Poribacteria bacterium]MBT5532005.1 chemotaxis protein CheW [Candidatus Poribacteria bacterium]MBT5710469.1 chemotaxis protein CheW [Candidatus Poribacteria bacterium]MBT7100991.1 chemotaxis protein CheW [Candidatus Poribacteria bacterium]MBT7804943.1 chemotaxis protein CheW [Candidatus Poribacteria bacterium]
MEQARQYCTFMLDGYYFGVDATAVQEVLVDRHVTHVPLAPEVVPGVINLRGDIVTTVDLRCRLELSPRDTSARPVHVVVGVDQETVSFLVDEVGEVIEASAENFEPPPDNLRGAARDLILGSHKLESRLLLVLDIERAAAFE